MMRLLMMSLFFALVGCAGTHADSNVIEPVKLSSAEQERGQVLFMRMCHACHPDGDAGLGPSLHGVRFLSPAVHLQIRAGVGEMPAFHGDKLPHEDLEAILAYLRHLDDKG